MSRAQHGTGQSSKFRRQLASDGIVRWRLRMVADIPGPDGASQRFERVVEHEWRTPLVGMARRWNHRARLKLGRAHYALERITDDTVRQGEVFD